LVAVAGVTPWLAFALRIDALYRPILRGAGYRAAFHPVAEVQGFLSLFAAGLLFEALPRRTGARPATWWEWSLAALCGVATAAAGWAERWELAQVAWALLVLCVAAFVGRRRGALAGPGQPRTAWIAAALAAAVGGAALAALGAPGSRPHEAGRSLLWQGVFTALALGAAGLIGRPSTALRRDQGERNGPSAWLAHAAGAALFLGSFALDGLASRRAGFAARAAVCAGFAAFPILGGAGRGTPLGRRLAAAAMAALPLGYAWAALDPVRRRAGLHLIYLGSFTALALLAWSALAPRGGRAGPVPWIAGLLGLALVSRVVLELDLPSFHLWLGLACGAFAAGVLAWAGASLRGAPSTPGGSGFSRHGPGA
jgi:hypothetical protein